MANPCNDRAWPAGVDSPALHAWLRDHLPESRGTIGIDLISAGQSNLTYIVHDDEDHRWVLRRPPLHHALASAHDVVREARILVGVSTTDVPVPPVRAVIDDRSILGAPFYVMDFVDGHLVRDPAGAEALLTPTARWNASRDLVATLSAIHHIDVDAAGLGDLGKREHYVQRQLRRWKGQREAAAPTARAEFAVLERWLDEHAPADGHIGLVHGDYRLENTIVGDDGHLRAVLDWELSTLGDTRADLGILGTYWNSNAAAGMGAAAPTLADGFASWDQVVAWYVELSGDEVSDIDYFLVLALWKLACIGEGVKARYASGAMASRFGDASSVELAVTTQLQRAIAMI